MKTTLLAGVLGAAFTLQGDGGSIPADATILSWDIDEAPHVSLELVGGANAAAAGVVLAFHDRLGLAEASPLARSLYLATAGYAAYSLQRATSIVFGHEGAHFHAAGLSGRTGHSFIEADGKTIPLQDAFLEALRTGHVGGFALSRDPEGASASPDELMRANNAGPNWQSDYADRLLHRGFAFGDRTVFSAADYLLNRNYWARYALKDQRKGRGLNRGGDPQDLAEHLEAHHGVTDALDSMVAWSAAAALLSASNHQALGALSDYARHGSTALFDERITWSISNYGYDDSFSVAPVVHVRAKTGTATWFGGFETSVIGDDWTEVHLGATLSRADLNLEAALTIGEHGGLVEIGAEKRINDHLGARAWMAVPVGSGETRRGMRITPEDELVMSTGLVFRF